MGGTLRWGGLTLLVGFLGPLQPSFAVAAVLGGGGGFGAGWGGPGGLGWAGGGGGVGGGGGGEVRWIWTGRGEFDVYDIYFRVFFSLFFRVLLPGFGFCGGDWVLIFLIFPYFLGS